MMRLASAFGLAAIGVAASAQVFPTPGPETPRIQSVDWQANEPIVLTAFPNATLTVMLEPGEAIQRAVLTGNQLWEVTVSAENDSFQVKPLVSAAPASLSVETNARAYEFMLETGQDLQAAYLVRVSYPGPDVAAETALTPEITGLDWSYRLRGDKSVRPASIRDNGEKTVIEYAPGQPLPAVFAIGATGKEEVVDGYMRGEKFVIDRVHQRLVFRIDKEKATARRNKRKEVE